MKIKDAQGRLNAVENCLKSRDYVGALLEAERYLELSVKILLEKLDTSYRR